MAKHKQPRRTLEQTVGMPKSQLLFVLAIACIVAVSASLLSMTAAKLFYEDPRGTRIAEVFRSLDLNDEYIYQTGENAAQQRAFKSDGHRDWTSFATYLRGASLDETMREVDQRATTAGFQFVRNAHEGSTGVTGAVYRSERNEYLYVTVSSKQRNDYLQDALLMQREASPDELAAIDVSEGPVEVLIKLDISGEEK